MRAGAAAVARHDARQEPALGERHRDLPDRLVVSAVLREARRPSRRRSIRRAPRAARRASSSARHSSRNRWSTSTWVAAWSSARTASAETEPGLRCDERRPARPAQELGRNDALQVLVEFLEKSEPAPVGLQTQPVELLAERGESLGESPFDFGLEQFRPVRSLDRSLPALSESEATFVKRVRDIDRF